MTEEQWMSTISSKMMVQINIVRIGQEYIADNGSFTLITGIINVKPIPLLSLMQQLVEQLIHLLNVLHL